MTSRISDVDNVKIAISNMKIYRDQDESLDAFFLRFFKRYAPRDTNIKQMSFTVLSD